VGLGSPVSHLKAGPSESDLARLEEEISERLSATAEIRPAAAAKSSDEPPTLAPELEVLAEAPVPTEAAPPPVTPVTAPWRVQHARKLIAGGVILVAAGFAFFFYYPWQIQPKPVPAAPLPKTAAPESKPAPVAVPAPVAAPAPPAAPPAAPAPARATVPARPATAVVPSTAPAAAPVAAPAPARATVPARPATAVVTSRTSPPAAPMAVPARGPRVPTVTHTLREPEPEAAAAAPAPAPAAAAPKVAAPSDCPEQIAALGLCASHARKGGK
jgi:outer membrane biosynthesis protein TonB